MVYIATILLVTGFAAAVDINSSQELNYFNDGNLEFQVGTTGDITATGLLSMNNNDILSPGLVDGVDVGSPGNAIVVDASNQYAVDSNSIGLTELREGETDDRYYQLSGDRMEGHMDMDGFEIRNFFASQCAAGEVIAQVEDTGSYTCLDASDEVSGDYVGRTGDTMTGTLDMGLNGNDNIIGIGNLGGADIVNSGNINSDAVTSSELNETDNYSLGWDNLAISQADVSTSDLGAADSNINMNGNDITNIGFAHTNDLVVSNTADESLLPATANSAYIQGDISIDGDFIGAGADLAERMTENQDQNIESGEVVVLGENLSVERSTEAYDTGVAGVVSTDPAMVMAKEREGVELALSGTAPVIFTAENGGVEPGDLITTSSQPGKAMKCENPVECQGAIIGKAGESAESDGEIEILLTLS